jgi:glycosyltransferase involved in cell wall biosynthesis
MRSQLVKDTDQMSMAHGLEIRLPFLDKDFVKLTAKLSTKLKYRSGKSILSDSFKEILPDRIKKRKKQGFTFPLQEWQKSNPKLIDFKTHPNTKVRAITKKTFTNQNHWSRLWVLSFLEKDLLRTRILFLTLKTFSLMGGIERMNRVLMKAGDGIKKDLSSSFTAFSVYDQQEDVNPAYISKKNFKGFSGNLFNFFMEVVSRGNKYDQVILSHIHLAPAGLILKYLHRSEVFVIAHGVEVWKKLNLLQRLMLRNANSILAVSNFTRNKIHHIHQILLNKIQIFHNCLDPFIKPSISFKTKEQNDVPIIFTLCRISSSELYKGYYQVIAALALLAKQNIDFRYCLGGKYEQQEYQNIIKYIAEQGITDKVELCGYISDSDLPSYFDMADIFILPSKKEGFGLVFTEAIVSGVPVIAGNKDGSVDALLNGELGVLVDPDNVEEIASAIKQLLLSPPSQMTRAERTKLALANFDFSLYKQNLIKLLRK